jgi:hypothetical protein
MIFLLSMKVETELDKRSKMIGFDFRKKALPWSSNFAPEKILKKRVDKELHIRYFVLWY